MTDVTGGPVPGSQNDPLRRPGAGGPGLGETRAFGGVGDADREAKVRRAADRAASATNEALDRGEGLLTAGIDTAQAKAEEARRWALQQRDTLRETVLEHPMTSCVAAFGGGLILGLLLARR